MRKYPPIEPGNRYFEWTVLGEAPTRIYTKGKSRVWYCRCSCGKEQIVAGGDLNGAKHKSCRLCAAFKLSAERFGTANPAYKNGSHREHRGTYKSWQGLKDRCLNPNNKDYPNYGGRGIGVYVGWVGPNGFTQFLLDMGERPEGRSIDRINVNGDYTPTNCRWATPKEQMNNQRRHV